MYCNHCGNPIDDDALFCPICGNRISVPPKAPVVEQPQAPAYEQPQAPAYGQYQQPGYNQQNPFAAGQQPQYQQPAPVRPRKPRKAGSKKGLLAAIIGGAAAVVILAGVAIGAVVMNTPQAKIMRSMSNSFSAYSEALENIPVSAAPDLISSGAFRQDMRLEMKDSNGMGMPSGVGVAISNGVNLKDREADLRVTPFYGSMAMLNAEAALNDDVIAFRCPELLPNSSFGLNTKTLGQDLYNMGLPSDVQSLGFNIFDLYDTCQTYADEQMDLSNDQLKSVQKFAKSMEFKKIGKESMNINRNRIDCIHYTVTIPRDSMEDLLISLVDASAQMDYSSLVRDVLTQVGMPRDLVDEVVSDMPAMDYLYIYDDIRIAMDRLGDLQFDVYTKGSYVMAVEFSKMLDGSRMDISLQMGGGKNYADDLSLTISFDGDYEEYIITSSGNHSGKDGVFTDTTVIQERYQREVYSEIRSDFSYDSRKDTNNLRWDVVSDEICLSASGTLTAGKNTLNLNLDTLRLYDDYNSFTLAAQYSIYKYNQDVVIENPTMIFEMRAEDFNDLYRQAQKNLNGLMRMME